MSEQDLTLEMAVSFFEQPQVIVDTIPVGQGVPIGIERVFHPNIGIGGAYGTWGTGYDNEALTGVLKTHFGEAFTDEDRMDLSQLGFVSRHHVPDLSPEEHLQLEIEVGARFLREAAAANGWKPEEVEGVMIGMTLPVADDYTEKIARAAGIPDSAIKVSIHKACDGSMGALHLLLNPDLPVHQQMHRNLAQELAGKKVLVGGIEGLSRYVQASNDKSALQLFGNGAGIIGVIPGENMKFLVGEAHEAFDEQGVLEVSMYYPHSRQRMEGQSMIEVSQAGENHFRVAGMMHEPGDGTPVVMAGPMGMVKLFVRTGVGVVRRVYERYQSLMNEVGSPKEISFAIVHHANLKINRLIDKRLRDVGINLQMPWVVSEFGNVSAASNMIAFLRKLPSIKPGDHILFDGFGAGTYYDAFAVSLGEGS
ncbi:MAG: 3-oxoacyl-[acyl-carrier-protein] synthase III C-terminal domain-containing protein [Anaerolineales bacterium]